MVVSDNGIVEGLKSFGRTRKFSALAWKKRGLLPPSSEVSQRLELSFNTLATQLLLLVGNNASSIDLAAKLNDGLHSLDAADYDTEEREFICDLFADLASLLGLSISVKLNTWLYGDTLGDIATEISLDQANEPPLKTLTQLCTGCGSAFHTCITQEREDNLVENWLVVECSACSEYNFMVFPPKIGTTQANGYKFIECLWRDRYTLETAQERFQKLSSKRRNQLASSRVRNKTAS